MKRQTEDIFIKYKATAYQDVATNINIEIPEDVDFLPGDFVEMIISETPNFGGVGYYAKLVCYKIMDNNSLEIRKNVELVYGFLANGGDGDYPVQAKSASLSTDGNKKYISFYTEAPDAVFYQQGSKYFVNMIIHRSNNVIECPYS